MTSKEIFSLYNEGKLEELYKSCKRHFSLVDEWEEKLISGDMLSEYELADCIDKMTGCLMKFSPIAGALEALMANKEHNQEVKGYNDLGGKVRTQDCSVVRANARASVEDLRCIVSDFRNYFIASEKAVTSAMSRIKRLTLEKSAKRIDFTGDQSKVHEKEESNGWS